jgi:hypothetical protein
VTTRYHCSACGNLTRFDVVTSRRTRAFHHYTVGGELRVEDEVVLAESVDEVTCRWCGTGAAVEPIVEAMGDGPEGAGDAGGADGALVGSEASTTRAADGAGEI